MNYPQWDKCSVLSGVVFGENFRVGEQSTFGDGTRLCHIRACCLSKERCSLRYVRSWYECNPPSSCATGSRLDIYGKWGRRRTERLSTRWTVTVFVVLSRSRALNTPYSSETTIFLSFLSLGSEFEYKGKETNMWSTFIRNLVSIDEIVWN